MPDPVAAKPAVAGEALKTSRFKEPGEGSSVVISVVTVAAIFALWFVATNAGWIKPLFLPKPQTVAQQFYDYLVGNVNRKPLWDHFVASVLRVAAAFWAAVLTAVPVGVAMGMSRVARGIFDPPIEFYRPLPPLAYLPLIVIWFGIDETAKIVLIYLACFAPLAMAARAGVRSVTIEQINAAYSMGASKWQVIWHVVIPAAMPEIFTGMRIAIGFGWTTLVAAEMVAATTGLGQMVLNASNFLRTDVVIMGIIVNTIRVAKDKTDLEALIRTVDAAIRDMGFDDKYTVMFIGIADTAKRTFRYVNAAMADPILVAKGKRDLTLLPGLANRHGLVAGATGTGKTITLRVLAEGFSRAGVPVFLADVKGDLSGLARPGGEAPAVQQRAQALGLMGDTVSAPLPRLSPEEARQCVAAHAALGLPLD